jgi:hypothetical protein
MVDPTTPALLILGMLALVSGTFALLSFLSERKRKRQDQHRHSS